MTDDLTLRLQVLDVPASPDPAFAERLRLQFLGEAGVAPEVATPARPKRRWPQLGRVAWRPAIAVASFVVLLIVANVVVIPAPPSALAALQTARTQFASLPSYEATTRIAANESRDDPDFEQVWETRDRYLDADHWRSDILTSTGTTVVNAGDYRVFDGARLGEYTASTEVFVATPIEDLDDRGPLSPAFFHDPSLQWWSTGRPGEPGKPSDTFFTENCAATPGSYLGRPATTLTCRAEPSDMTFVLDDGTGMLLRVEVFDIVREITSISFGADFDARVFDVVPPEGARVHWAGRGSPPPEYAVDPGDATAWDVLGRIDVPPGAEAAGVTVEAVIDDTIWLSVIWCGNTCWHQLVAVDRHTGSLAVIDPPSPSFVSWLGEVEGEVWVALAGEPSAQLALRVVDASTMSLASAGLDVGSAWGGVASIEGRVWVVGGTIREVELGPARSEYASLVLVDLSTGEQTVTTLDDAGFALTPVTAGGRVWVGTQAIDPDDPYDTVHTIAEIDPSTGAVLRRIPLPLAPAGPPAAIGTDLVFLHVADGWYLSRLDTATGVITSAELAPQGSELGPPVFAHGSLWLLDYLGGGVLRVDPASLEVVETIPTGRGPTGIAADANGLWVAHVLDGRLVQVLPDG